MTNSQLQFEYLFLDIKWNQSLEMFESGECEPIQISVIATDSTFQKVKMFSRVITKHKRRGETMESVLSYVSRIFPEYHYLIVWTEDIYKFYESRMEKYGIPIKEYQVMVLQEIYKTISNDEEIDFENALRSAEIHYVTKQLQYSRYCVNYLFQLFDKFYERCMNSGCDLTQIRETEDVLKILPLTEKHIERICENFNVSYSIGNDTVFIRTAVARWIVYLRGNRVVKLFHENYRPSKSEYCKKQKMKCIEGYHQQKLPSENFYEVIQYIKRHDEGIVKRMVKKSRLERLLDRVERELKSTSKKSEQIL